MKQIAYQGVKGSYGDIAARKMFGLEYAYVGMKTFREVFEKVSKGEAALGIVPVENSLVGSIHENFDLLYQYDLSIHGEIHSEIAHCLLALSPEVSLYNLKRVISHPKALEQCRQFFQKNHWIEAVASFNTAEAALEVSKMKDPGCAAIASLEAAELYGLHPIAKNIQDSVDNYTRFAAISKGGSQDGNKCSLLMKLKHEPNSLFHVLEILAAVNLNLTKLESRPIPEKPFEYLFYLDFELNGLSVEQTTEILDELKNKTEFLKNLGFYKAGWPWKA